MNFTHSKEATGVRPGYPSKVPGMTLREYLALSGVAIPSKSVPPSRSIGRSLPIPSVPSVHNNALITQAPGETSVFEALLRYLSARSRGVRTPDTRSVEQGISQI